MRNINKFIGIANILASIFIIMNFFTNHAEIYYDWYYFYTMRFLIIVGISNIVFSIINFICKNKTIGKKFLVMGICRILPGLIFLNLSKIPDGLELFITLFYYAIITEVFFVVIEIIEIIIATRIISNVCKTQNNNEKIISKLFSAICALGIVFQIVIIVLPIALQIINNNNFDKAIAFLSEENEQNLYIVNEDDTNRYIVIDDQNGNIINEENYSAVSSNDLYLYTNGDKQQIFIVAENENENGVLINSKMEMVFEFTGGDYFALREYLDEKDLFEIESDKKTFNVNVQNNYLEKYEETRKQFENGEEEYFYFKNDSITDKVLQVVVNEELETDRTIMEKYYEPKLGDIEKNDIVSAIKNFDKKDISILNLFNFYDFEKEYYLIDFNSNSKVKLECNNLFYTLDGEGEYILLYSSTDIPFSDENECGYFNINDGTKVSFENYYEICDVDDKYVVLSDGKMHNTVFLEKNSKQEIEKLDGEMQGLFKEIYVTYSAEEDVFFVYDKEFNLIDTSFYTPKILGENIIELINEEDCKIYFIKGNIRQKLLTNPEGLNSAKSIWIKDINKDMEYVDENIDNKNIFMRMFN